MEIGGHQATKEKSKTCISEQQAVIAMFFERERRGTKGQWVDEIGTLFVRSYIEAF